MDFGEISRSWLPIIKNKYRSVLFVSTSVRINKIFTKQMEWLVLTEDMRRQ